MTAIKSHFQIAYECSAAFIFSKMTLSQVRDKSYSQIPDAMFYSIVDQDPTRTPKLKEQDLGGKFSRFLIERFIAQGEKEFWNGGGLWNDALERWLLAIAEKRIPANSDIFRMKTVADIDSYIFLGDKENFEVIYNKDGLLLVHPKTQAASCFFGKHFENSHVWCTAWPNGSYYATYARDGYIVIAIKGSGNLLSAEGVLTKDKMQFYVRDGNVDMEIEAYGKVTKTLEDWVKYLGPDATGVWMAWLDDKDIAFDLMQYRDDGMVQWTRDLDTGATERREERENEDGDWDNDDDEEVNLTDCAFAEIRHGYLRLQSGRQDQNGDWYDEEHDDLDIHDSNVDGELLENLGGDLMIQLDVSPYDVEYFLNEEVPNDFVRDHSNADDRTDENPFGDSRVLWEGLIPTGGSQDSTFFRMLARGQSDARFQIEGGTTYYMQNCYRAKPGAVRAFLESGSMSNELFEYYGKVLGIEDETGSGDVGLDDIRKMLASKVGHTFFFHDGGGSVAPRGEGEFRAVEAALHIKVGGDRIALASFEMAIATIPVRKILRAATLKQADKAKVAELVDGFYPDPYGHDDEDDGAGSFAHSAVVPVVSVTGGVNTRSARQVMVLDGEFHHKMFDFLSQYLADSKMILVTFSGDNILMRATLLLAESYGWEVYHDESQAPYNNQTTAVLVPRSDSSYPGKGAQDLDFGPNYGNPLPETEVSRLKQNLEEESAIVLREDAMNRLSDRARRFFKAAAESLLRAVADNLYTHGMDDPRASPEHALTLLYPDPESDVRRAMRALSR